MRFVRRPSMLLRTPARERTPGVSRQAAAQKHLRSCDAVFPPVTQFPRQLTHPPAPVPAQFYGCILVALGRLPEPRDSRRRVVQPMQVY